MTIDFEKRKFFPDIWLILTVEENFEIKLYELGNLPGVAAKSLYQSSLFQGAHWPILYK